MVLHLAEVEKRKCMQIFEYILRNLLKIKKTIHLSAFCGVLFLDSCGFPPGSLVSTSLPKNVSVVATLNCP